jgi:predicted HAD superfamily Cof-like phosphohydrolase
MTNFELVGEFMNAFGQEIKESVRLPSENVQQLRVDLIAEELDELKEALAQGDSVEVADALTDLLYVVYGAGHAFGMDLDRCFQEVHSSNMSKLGDDGKPIYRDDGKVMKGPDFFQPNLHKCLNWS